MDGQYLAMVESYKATDRRDDAIAHFRTTHPDVDSVMATAMWESIDAYIDKHSGDWVVVCPESAELFGPFDTAEEGNEWAKGNLTCHWWISPLSPF